MSAAQPSNPISQERLNQIAGRKLAALSILVRPSGDRRTLEGEYVFKTAQVHYPGTESSIPKARFIVRGHDHLRFVDPPLSALGDIQFYDLERPTALEERVGQLMRQRLQELDKAAAELRRLRLPYKLDSQRLGLKATVKTAQHTFELVVFPQEARILRVEPVNAPAFEVSAEHPPLRLPDFRLLVDLELYLSTDAERMRQQAVQPPKTPVAKVEPVAPEPGQLTLGMLVQRLGADAVLSPSSELTLFQDFQMGATRYRLELTRQEGAAFRATLMGPGGGERPSDIFDVTKFPGTGAVVAAWLQAPQAAATPAAAGAVPTHLMPHPGEVWVMNVIVEQETADEIRYVCTDTDGKPYGASRILRRADFESAFVRHGTGWRLLIQIDEVQGDAVIYRQLDGQRQTRGQPRRLVSGVLVSTFLPEAAAY